MKRSFKSIEDKIRKINIYLKGVPEKEARREVAVFLLPTDIGDERTL